MVLQRGASRAQRTHRCSAMHGTCDRAWSVIPPLSLCLFGLTELEIVKS